MERLETHLHTEFSFLDGVGNAQEYVNRAKKLGMKALFFTDHGNITGAFDFYEKCTKNNIIPIIGCEFYIANNSEDKYKDLRGKDRLNRYHLIAYAKNQEGLKNLYKLSSMGWDNYDRRPIIFVDDLMNNSEGLVISSSCILSIIKDEQILIRFKEKFKDDFYLEIQPLDLSKDWDRELLKFVDKGKNDQIDFNKKMIEWSKKYDIKLLTTADVHYPDKDWKIAQDVFILNSFAGSKGWHFSTENHYLMDKEEFWGYFKKYGHDEYFTYEEYEKTIENSYEIVEKCKDVHPEKNVDLMRFPCETHRYYKEGDSPKDLITKCILNSRHSELLQKEEYLSRLKFELKIIEEKGFYDYFLIMEDIIDWNRNQGYLIGPGRGSAAGCLLAYFLGIHHIDPIKYNLLFERFLSIDRSNLPDIDTDFENQAEAKGYLVKKYGRDRVASIGAWQIARIKTAIKDCYRILKKDDYNYEYINDLTSQINTPANMKEDEERQFFFDLLDIDNPNYNEKFHKFIEENIDIGKTILKVLAKRKVLKIHACAMVLSNKPLREVVPLWINKPGSSEATFGTCFPGDHCEKSGLVKLDILSVNTLKDISNCLKLIKERKNLDIDIYSLDVEDKKTLELFSLADTDSIFQFNTPTLQKTLLQMSNKGRKPLTFNDLVATVAMVRPGPADAKFPDTYIARRNGKMFSDERYIPIKLADGVEGKKKVGVNYKNPNLDKILEETYGVIIYQEQIMEAFGVLGGFTKAEQNNIRKAISKSSMKPLEEAKKKFLEYATTVLEPKWTEDDVDNFYNDVIGFGKYAFNKSHSVSYAYLGFICQYLKVNFPTEWWAGVLMNSSEEDVKMVSKNRKDFFLSIDINESKEKFTLINESVRFPFNYIKGVGDGAITNIIENQPYVDLDDFLKRTNGRSVRFNTCLNLIVSGAFKNIESLPEEDLVIKLYSKKKKEIPQELLMIREDKMILENLRREADPFYSRNWLEKFKSLFSEDTISFYKARKKKQNELVKIGGEVGEIKIKKTKNGKDFANLILKSGSDQISIKVWSDCLKKLEDQKVNRKGLVIEVEGKVDIWNDTLSIVLKNVRNISL